MAGNRSIEHISRDEINKSLESRISYLHSFLDFNSSDIEALQSGAKYITALIPAIVNIVYKKLLQYDITARAFTTRSTSFEGPIDEVPSEESPQILHRKMFLRAYLKKLCDDPEKMEFWEYLDKVGMMHVGLGRAHPLHIEFIHLGATLALIQDTFTEAILSHPRLTLPRKTALLKAIGKIIWIQNDLFAKWQVGAEEFAVENGTSDVVIEKEGWLKGKKILSEDKGDGECECKGECIETEQNEEEKTQPAGKGSCPFSSIPKEPNSGCPVSW